MSVGFNRGESETGTRGEGLKLLMKRVCVVRWNSLSSPPDIQNRQSTLLDTYDFTGYVHYLRQSILGFSVQTAKQIGERKCLN